MTDPRPNRIFTDTDTVALLEEVARVDVRAIETGRVRVSTHTETIEEVARAVLHGETVEVTRVALNQPVTGARPEMRQEGDVTIVPVFEEVLVVEKRLMLKEELHIRKRATSETVTVPVTLQHQAAKVERLDGDGNPVP